MQAITKAKPIEEKEWKKGFDLIEREKPKLTSQEEVIIKVRSAAICGTDVGIYNCKDSIKKEMLRAVTDPITVGHEFCGIIVEAGEKAKLHISRLVVKKSRTNIRVKKIIGNKTAISLSKDSKFIKWIGQNFYATAEMHITCGNCRQCQLGEYHVCRNTIINGLHDNGAFAEYLRVPANNIRLYFGNEIHPDIISFMDALGNATHTVLSAEVKERDVAILGCGIQGLMAVAVAKLSGARRIFVTDLSNNVLTHNRLVAGRFKLAKMYGADACFDMAFESEREQFYERVMNDTDGAGVDVVYEMSGSYEAYKDAKKILRMGGTFALLGIPSGTFDIDFAKNIIFSGITVRGIIGRKVFETWNQMEELLKKGMSKIFLNSGFISHRFSLNEYERAFEAIRTGEAYKVLLVP